MRKKLILMLILAIVMPFFAACSCDCSGGNGSGGTQDNGQGDISETPEDTETPEEPGGDTTFAIAYTVGKNCGVDESVLIAMKKSGGKYPASYAAGVGATVDGLRNDHIDETYAYTFLGWYYDEGCTLACDDGVIGAEKTGALTLYAKIEKTALTELDPDDDRNWTDSQ